MIKIKFPIDEYYDLYAAADKQLAIYKEKGGFYKHIYSLLCRRRKNKYKNLVIKQYEEMNDLPVLAEDNNVIISLTTFPPRINGLHLVIKSLLMQTYKVDRIVVWLSEEEFPSGKDGLPVSLTSLETLGVEFRFVEGNLRSHKKYFYVFDEFPGKDVITVDDDLIYSSDTVERLIKMKEKHPGTVCANVIRKVRFNEEGGFRPYKKWSKPGNAGLSSNMENVAVGCGGVFYPSSWYDENLFDIEIIKRCCPMADDLWLKANQLRRGVTVTGGGDFFAHPIILPNTQSVSLQRKNNGSVNMNDDQWNSLNELWNLEALFDVR